MSQQDAADGHRRAPLVLIGAGLAAQVVGVSTQGVWHGLLAGRQAGLLTEDRTFLIDHTISNAGVVCMITGCVLLHRWHPRTAGTRLTLAGTALESTGALLDAYAHLRGGENPVAFGLIGAGFLLAAGGVLTARRAQRRRSASRAEQRQTVGEKIQSHDHYRKGTLYCGQYGSRLILTNNKTQPVHHYPAT